MNKIYFVTGNEHKAAETAAIVPDVQRISLGLPEIQSLDAEEVITAKLTEAHRQMPDKILVVEDVTYSIAGMGGLPGTLIKWFISSVGPAGLYDLVKDKDTSTIVCANLGLVYPSGEMVFVVGEVAGRTVAADEKGGYVFDKIFIPDGHTKRYSEMTNDEKNSISHRAVAWRKLEKLLSERSSDARR